MVYGLLNITIDPLEEEDATPDIAAEPGAA
jgi:hypothetical protein